MFATNRFIFVTLFYFEHITSFFCFLSHNRLRFLKIVQFFLHVFINNICIISAEVSRSPSWLPPGKADRPALPQRVSLHRYHHFVPWQIVQITQQCIDWWMHFIHKTLNLSYTTCRKSITSWMQEWSEKNA